MNEGNRHTVKLSVLLNEIREIIQDNFEIPHWISCEIDMGIQ